MPQVRTAALALLAALTIPAVPASSDVRTPSTPGPVPTVYDANADGLEDDPDDAVPAPPYDDGLWAPPAEARIRPGNLAGLPGGECTSNFVFVRTSSAGGIEHLVDVLLGTAAHCLSEASTNDDCRDEALPIGTPTAVEGATAPSTLAYHAALSMQRVGETDRDTCHHNDLALIRLSFADWPHVNPSLRHMGGPVAVATDPPAVGDAVWSWGNSTLREGIRQTSPKRGIALRTTNSGRNHDVYLLTPGIPGDSGSAVLDADGRALGVLSTLSLATGWNSADDIGMAIAWARANEPTMAGLRLEPGTEPFDPSGWPFLP